MLAALGGSAPLAPLVQVIFKETEGNPFFVEEVFHHLKEEGRLVHALEAATSSQLIVEQRRGRDVDYGFAHALIRQTLLGTLWMPRRQRRHLKIAADMEAALGDRASQRASDLAYHLYQGGSAADPRGLTSRRPIATRACTTWASHLVRKSRKEERSKREFQELQLAKLSIIVYLEEGQANWR